MGTGEAAEFHLGVFLCRELLIGAREATSGMDFSGRLWTRNILVKLAELMRLAHLRFIVFRFFDWPLLELLN